MRAYIIRRLLISIPLVFMMTFVVFAAINLSPQSAIDQFVMDPKIPAQLVEAEKERTGYYDSLPRRYLKWLMGVLGDIRFGRDRKVLIRYTDEKGFASTYRPRLRFGPDIPSARLDRVGAKVDLLDLTRGVQPVKPWLGEVLTITARLSASDAEAAVVLRARFAGEAEPLEKPVEAGETPEAFEATLTLADLAPRNLAMSELQSLELELLKGDWAGVIGLDYRLDSFRFPEVGAGDMDGGEARSERIRPYLILEFHGAGRLFELQQLESPYTTRLIEAGDWLPMKEVPQRKADGAVRLDEQGKPVMARKTLEYDDQGRPVFREQGFRALELGFTNYTQEQVELTLIVRSGGGAGAAALRESRFPMVVEPRDRTTVDLPLSELEESGVDLEHVKGIALQSESPGKVALNRIALVEDQAFVGVGGWPNFGRSYRDGRPVLSKIFSAVGNTIVLIVSALLITWMVAIPAGIAAAARQYKASDKLISFLSFVGMAMPSFFLAVLIRLFASEYLPWLPNAGRTSEGYPDMVWYRKIADLASHALLPVLTMALGGMAGLQRIMRANMLENQRQQYVTTARAKGLSERVVILKHVLRNAITPFVAAFGSFFPALLGGSLFIEIIFSYPGVGRLMYEAVLHRDQNMIMANTLMAALLLVVGNLVADVLLAIVDPRVSYD